MPMVDLLAAYGLKVLRATHMYIMCYAPFFQLANLYYREDVRFGRSLNSWVPVMTSLLDCSYQIGRA